MPPRKKEDQYHHFIPRFVLRSFQDGPRRSRAERAKERRKTGEDPEYVLFYDIAAGSLERRSISTVYGIKNLYRDVRNPANVNIVEDKLSKLENDAAAIIRRILESSGSFELTRLELGKLRKFLFIMRFRSQPASVNSFNPDYQENATVSVRQLLESMGKRLGLTPGPEMWLHFMGRILDTDHDTLTTDGGQILKYDDLVDRLRSNSLDVDPITDYFLFASLYYLGFWEAPQGEEFIIGDHAFGLWEGFKQYANPSGTSLLREFDINSPPQHKLHYLYVINPRLAVVLRLNELHPQNINPPVPGSLSSDLMGIPLTPAVPTYKTPLPQQPANLNSTRQALDIWEECRSRPHAAKDAFQFTTTRLTKMQMQTFNDAILLNCRPAGGLTFLTKDTTLRTITAFCENPIFLILEMQEVLRLRPLLIALKAELSRSTADVPDPRSQNVPLLSTVAPSHSTPVFDAQNPGSHRQDLLESSRNSISFQGPGRTKPSVSALDQPAECPTEQNTQVDDHRGDPVRIASKNITSTSAPSRKRSEKQKAKAKAMLQALLSES